ncbi:MAG: hypothetical protein PSX36_10785 [bacterium]|nr:hypothetical protein [bacterium]
MKNSVRTPQVIITLLLFFACYRSGKAQCTNNVENSTECDVAVVIDFWCGGQQLTNNAPINITKKTTYTPTWPSYLPNPCSPCDMSVKIVGWNGWSVGPPNVVSVSNPGPVAPDVSAVSSTCWNNNNLVVANMPQLWFDGTLYWIFW